MPDTDSEPAGDVLRDLTIIGPLRLDDARGSWEFAPQADITALESSLIFAMLTKTLALGRRLDWREYLTREHLPRTDAGSDVNALRIDLARHFRPME